MGAARRRLFITLAETESTEVKQYSKEERPFSLRSVGFKVPGR